MIWPVSASCEPAPARLLHPQVGELCLNREKLAVAGGKGQVLVVFHAEPGTSSAEKLALLGSLATPAATATTAAMAARDGVPGRR